MYDIIMYYIIDYSLFFIRLYIFICTCTCTFKYNHVKLDHFLQRETCVTEYFNLCGILCLHVLYLLVYLSHNLEPRNKL